MESKNQINWTAEGSRFVAPTAAAVVAAGDFALMGGVRPQADDATVLGSHTWSPPIT